MGGKGNKLGGVKGINWGVKGAAGAPEGPQTVLGGQWALALGKPWQACLSFPKNPSTFWCPPSLVGTQYGHK